MNKKELNQKMATYCFVLAVFYAAFCVGMVMIFSGVGAHHAGIMTWEQAMKRVIIGLGFLLTAVPLEIIKEYLYTSLAKARRTYRREMRKEERIRRKERELIARFNKISKEIMNEQKVADFHSEMEASEKEIHFTDDNGFKWRTDDGINWNCIGVVGDTIVTKSVSMPVGKVEGAK